MITLLGSLLVAQELRVNNVPARRPINDVRQIQQARPGFLVVARADRLSRDYREGEMLSIDVCAEIDSYVYVLYQQADGSIYQVFPNSRQANNRLKAKQAIHIPSKDDLFRWKVGPPYGKEVIKVVASERPIDALSNPELRSQRFNPVAKSVLKAVAAEFSEHERKEVASRAPAGSDNSVRRGEFDLEITTYPANHQLIESGGRRFGVFFGASKYKYSDICKDAFGHSSNVVMPEANAKRMRDLLTDVGQLNEERVYLNEQVTKENLKAAICDYLAHASRPGDTVIIYYSGHGDELRDKNQPDKKPEYFLDPYELLGLGEYLAMVKQFKAGKLAPEYLPPLKAAQAALEAAIKQGKIKTDDDVERFLVELSGVSDDEFARWLQHLSGRKIVLILETCHSGGFAKSTANKSIGKGMRPIDFRFLEEPLGRLKEIEQPGTVVLTGCGPGEESSNLVAIPELRQFSEMTFCLGFALQAEKGSVDVDKAFARCKTEMRKYFASEDFKAYLDVVQKKNEELKAAGKPALTVAQPHDPYLFKFTDEPIYLKP